MISSPDSCAASVWMMCDRERALCIENTVWMCAWMGQCNIDPCNMGQCYNETAEHLAKPRGATELRAAVSMGPTILVIRHMTTVNLPLISPVCVCVCFSSSVVNTGTSQEPSTSFNSKKRSATRPVTQVPCLHVTLLILQPQEPSWGMNNFLCLFELCLVVLVGSVHFIFKSSMYAHKTNVFGFWCVTLNYTEVRR